MNQCPKCGIEQKTRNKYVFRNHIKNCKGTNLMQEAPLDWTSADAGTW